MVDGTTDQPTLAARFRALRHRTGRPRPDVPFCCPECAGSSYDVVPLGHAGDGTPMVQHDACAHCGGTGMCCPTCRGANWVRRINRSIIKCPTCHPDGDVFSRHAVVDAIERLLDDHPEMGAPF